MSGHAGRFSDTAQLLSVSLEEFGGDAGELSGIAGEFSGTAEVLTGSPNLKKQGKEAN